MTGDSARDYFRPHQSGRPANSAQLKRPCHSPHPPFPRPSHVPFSFFSLIFFVVILFLIFYFFPPLLSLSCSHCLRVFLQFHSHPAAAPVDVLLSKGRDFRGRCCRAPFISSTRSFSDFVFLPVVLIFIFFFFPISSTIRQVDDNGVLLLDFPGRQLHDGYYLNLAQERAFCSTPPSIVTHLALHRHKIRPGAFAISRSITSTLGRCATEALATPDRRPGWSSRMP